MYLKRTPHPQVLLPSYKLFLKCTKHLFLIIKLSIRDSKNAKIIIHRISDCCVVLSLFYAEYKRFTFGYYFDYSQSSGKKKTGRTGYRFLKKKLEFKSFKKRTSVENIL